MVLLDFLRPRRLSDPQALTVFLHRQAAFVAQKTVEDYCRVKAGRAEREHFGDAGFRRALDHCRWQVFPAALADLALILEAVLRRHAPAGDAALAAGVLALHAEALRLQAPPESEREALEDAARAFPGQLAASRAADPPPAHRRPLLSEPVLFSTLPIHPDQRRGEAPSIRGALRMHLLSSLQEFERRFDVPGVAAAIASRAVG